MDFRSFTRGLAFRIAFLLVPLLALSYGLSEMHTLWIIGASIFIIIATIILFRYSTRRIKEMSYFFESIKYKDFSRQFSEVQDSPDIIELHKGFNITIDTIKEVNIEKETQFLFLQKIIDIIDTGIVCHDVNTGEVVWMNATFRDILDIPMIKNVNFIEKRFPEAYHQIFSSETVSKETLSISGKNDKQSYIISNSTFIVKERTFRLIAIQDIELNLNQNESEAWKKLLSVMTHEIMNSIAPISSLAETLKNNVISKDQEVNMEDLAVGIQSIQSRSEGLLKFAQTYRSLNKVTHINAQDCEVKDLFSGIKNLLLPSLEKKGIQLIVDPKLENFTVSVDKHLVDQVLINLILNAVEAFPDQEEKRIILSASRKISGPSTITVADNGSGIPADIQSQIFIPFFTTKKQGNGIGLSLCKQIMVLHKGQIQVQSAESKGTKVKLVFPS